MCDQTHLPTSHGDSSRIGNAKLGNAAQPFFQGYPQFSARKKMARALMNTITER